MIKRIAILCLLLLLLQVGTSVCAHDTVGFMYPLTAAIIMMVPLNRPMLLLSGLIWRFKSCVITALIPKEA